MKKLRNRSIAGFGASASVAGTLIMLKPGADWYLVVFLYGIAAGLFGAVLWLMYLDRHFAGAQAAQSGAEVQPGTSNHRAPNNPAQPAPAGNDAPAPRSEYTVRVPFGMDVAHAVAQYAERIGMRAYQSPSTGAFYVSDGRRSFAIRTVTEYGNRPAPAW